MSAAGVFRGRTSCWLAATATLGVVVCLAQWMSAIVRADLFVSAATNGDVAQVKRMLRGGIRPDTHDPLLGETALQVACRKSCRELVVLLLAKGADANSRDRSRVTPLMETARAGDPEIARMLIEHGALPDLRNDTGQTAADWATWFHQPQVSRVIREAAGLRRGVGPTPRRTGT